MKKTFGEYIHNLRIENSMTLTQLGAKLEIDSGALSKIENGGKRLDEKTLPKLVEVFQLNLDEIRKEFISEQIAFRIFESGCTNNVLNLAEQKIQYIKQNNLTQIKFKFQ